MEDLEKAIKADYFNTDIQCLSCEEVIRASECTIIEKKCILCPVCKKDICGEE